MTKVQSNIKDRVESTILQYENIFGDSIVRPVVDFSLTGRTAGWSNYGRGMLNFNVQLAEANESDFLGSTVPHEVAHWVQRHKYGYYQGTKKVMPHGAEWKYLMRVIGVAPVRCHSYDTTKVAKRKLKTYTFKCSCKEWELTSIRFNRYIKGVRYNCPKCKVVLSPK